MTEQLIKLFQDYLTGWSWEEWQAAGSSDREEVVVNAIADLGPNMNIEVEEAYDLFYDWAAGLTEADFAEPITEAAQKTFKISYYDDEVKKSFTVQARDKAEAERIAWSRVDADSIYVSEVVTEATDINASKKFWAAAKNKQIDIVSFHAAFDDELKDLDLMDVFNNKGTLWIYSSYGTIRQALDANPDSWAVKALQKLWGLTFKDKASYTPESIAYFNEKNAEEAAQAEKEKAEKERLANEEREAYLKSIRDLLPDALKKVDPEKLEKYKSGFGVTEADFDVAFAKSRTGEALQILPGKSGYLNRKPTNVTIDSIISIVNNELTWGIEKLAEIKRKEAAKTNEVIDIFKANPGQSCSAILLGESGTLYSVSTSGNSNTTTLSAKTGSEVVGAGYVKNVPEAYKVIFTELYTSYSSSNIYKDSGSDTYYSWDSAETSKLGALIPKIGKYSGTMYYGEVSDISAEAHSHYNYYSSMDDIDSWAHDSYTSVATG